MIRLVRATDADRDRVLAWRNSPDGIATSGSQYPVTESQHRDWWSGHAMSGACDLSIIEIEPTGPVGMVRLDAVNLGRTKSVSVFVEDKARRRGIALAALRQIVAVNPVVEAVVRKDNAASQKLFRRAGFVPEIETPTVTIFAWRRAADA